MLKQSTLRRRFCWRDHGTDDGNWLGWGHALKVGRLEGTKRHSEMSENNGFLHFMGIEWEYHGAYEPIIYDTGLFQHDKKLDIPIYRKIAD